MTWYDPKGLKPRPRKEKPATMLPGLHDQVVLSAGVLILRMGLSLLGQFRI